MSKKYFVKFVSEPRNDTIKTIVGVACASRAISEGHEGSVFFAAAGTRLLDPAYIEELNKEMGEDSTVVSDMMESITENATLYCSFASVKATLGHSEGDGESYHTAQNYARLASPPFPPSKVSCD